MWRGHQRRASDGELWFLQVFHFRFMMRLKNGSLLLNCIHRRVAVGVMGLAVAFFCRQQAQRCLSDVHDVCATRRVPALSMDLIVPLLRCRQAQILLAEVHAAGASRRVPLLNMGLLTSRLGGQQARTRLSEAQGVSTTCGVPCLAVGRRVPLLHRRPARISPPRCSTPAELGTSCSAPPASTGKVPASRHARRLRHQLIVLSARVASVWAPPTPTDTHRGPRTG